MLQSFATMMSSAMLIGGLGLIALFLRNDWSAIGTALGFRQAIMPLPPVVHMMSARRAAIVRIELVEFRRAA